MGKENAVPAKFGMDLSGGKGKSRIDGDRSSREVMRYNEFRKELNAITDVVLAAMLMQL